MENIMKKWFKSLSKRQNDSEDGLSVKDKNDLADSHPISDDSKQFDSSDGGTDETSVSESQSSHKSKTKKPWSVKKKVIVTIAGVLGALVIGIGIFAASIFIDPMSHFEAIAPLPSAPAASLPVESGDSPTPTPTLSEYDQLVAKSDFGILEQTVNILLIGVDYAPERNDWEGKHYYHSDVMIVLAINKETGSVNLISLPRDTYAEIPGVEGIYKLNASMDCGGGWKDNPAGGCKKVCEAASWMIGGIPINYYYAVDMSAVKELVNAIGGVDFNIDVVDFKMQGREYKTGLQHMDGQAVLDYLRVRKDIGEESGDKNRVNRQKNMLVAIVQKLKDSGLIFKIPDIINAFSGNLQTNVDLASTGALAAYASQIDTRCIKMYSMGGPMHLGLFNWNFVITDQDNRVKIIKDVYGFDISSDADVQALEAKYGIKVPSYDHYTKRYALNLWHKMQAKIMNRQAPPLLDDIKSKLDADAQLPPYPELVPVQDPATGEMIQPPPVPSDGYRRYLSGCAEWQLYNKVDEEFSRMDDIEQLQLDIQALCEKFGIKKSEKEWKKYWHVDYGDHAGKRSANQPYVKNEMPVDFN